MRKILITIGLIAVLAIALGCASQQQQPSEQQPVQTPPSVDDPGLVSSNDTQVGEMI